MWKRFLGFVVAGALFAAFGYLFYLNPGTTDFRLSPSRSYTLPLPLLLFLAFLAGGALIFALALVRETQWTLADVRRRRREEKDRRRREALERSRSLRWKGDPDAARAVLRRRLRDPRDLEARLVAAEASLDGRRTGEAIRILEQARELHPQEPRIFWLLARAQHALGESRAATASLEQARALEPESPRVLAALRDAYAADRRWADAVGIEESILRRSHDPGEAVREQPRLLGLRYEQALLADGDRSAARELRALVARSPSFLPAAVALGDRLRRLGDQRGAGRVWTRAARLRPEPVLLERLESLYRELDQPQKVLALYRRLRRRADSPILRLRLARFLLALGRAEEAATLLEPPDPGLAGEREYHALVGDLQRLRGNSELAIGAFRRALDRELDLRVAHGCAQCGRVATDWSARCAACGAWDSLRPEAGLPSPA